MKATGLHPENRLASCVVAVLCAVVVVVLVWLFDARFVTTDTVHLLDGARHLLGGSGYSSNLIFFEEQHAIGTVPVPQTVWPPGFSVAVAALLVFGVTPEQAGFMLGVAAFASTALIVYACLRAVGVATWVAIACSAICLSMALAGSLVLSVLTEPVFTALTILALLFLVRGAHQPGRGALWFWAAGAATAAALSVRYMGFAFGAAAGLAIILLHRRSAWSKLIGAGLAFGVMPAAVVSTLFLRNYRVGGSATGRPSVGDGDGPFDIVRNTYWAIADLFGFEDALWVEAAVLTSLFVVAAATIVRLSTSLSQSRSILPGERALLWCSSGYILMTLGLLVAYSSRESAGFMNERYLLPLIPFLVLLAGVSVPPLVARMPTTWRRAAYAVMGVMAVAFFIGQITVARSEIDWYLSDPRYSTVEVALQQPLGNATAGDYLRELSSREHPLLDADGQFLSYLLDRPVIGLPSTMYTDRIWSADEVKGLIDRFHVKYITFFPSLVEFGAFEQRNRVFYQDLARGIVPPWLALDVRLDNLVIFRVLTSD